MQLLSSSVESNCYLAVLCSSFITTEQKRLSVWIQQWVENKTRHPGSQFDSIMSDAECNVSVQPSVLTLVVPNLPGLYKKDNTKYCWKK